MRARVDTEIRGPYEPKRRYDIIVPLSPQRNRAEQGASTQLAPSSRRALISASAVHAGAAFGPQHALHTARQGHTLRGWRCSPVPSRVIQLEAKQMKKRIDALLHRIEATAQFLLSKAGTELC